MHVDDPFSRPNSAETDPAGAGLPDDLLDELDQTIDNLEMVCEPALKLTEESVDSLDGLSADPGTREMQLTFLELARNTLSPVARYIKAIAGGETANELLEISEMVVTPLIPKVEAVGLQKHAEDLSFFRSLLHLALGERDQAASRAMKEVVMEGFVKVAERFSINYRGYRLAVRNLVHFYRGIRKAEGVSEMDVRRFFAIGVPSLTWVRRTRVSEMVSLAGCTPEVMAQFRKVAYLYRSVPPMSSARLDRDHTILSPTPSIVREAEIDSSDIADAAIGTSEEPVIRGQA